MVSCPECGSIVAAEHLSRELGMGQCPSCDTIFETNEAALVPEAADSMSIAPVSLAPPASVTVERSDHGLVITHRWNWMIGVVFLAFSAVWFGFLSVFLSMAMMNGGDLMFLLFPMLHVIAGLVVLYTGASHLLNSTTLLVTKGNLAIEHGPLWWPGAKVIPTDSLEQLYVKRVVKRTKNGHSVTYDLRASVAQRDLKLVTGFPDAKPAKFMERAVESYLGIANRPVPDEYL